eukprot:1689238-Pleurochrysis_carterae.AAC.1
MSSSSSALGSTGLAALPCPAPPFRLSSSPCCPFLRLIHSRIFASTASFGILCCTQERSVLYSSL